MLSWKRNRGNLFIRKMDKKIEEKIMEIRYTLPGKARARIIQAPWKQGMIEAFRVLFQKYPNAEPISFDGHMIRKSV